MHHRCDVELVDVERGRGTIVTDMQCVIVLDPNAAWDSRTTLERLRASEKSGQVA